MRVLVTGGKGFIGTPLVKRLEDEGHEVRVFDLPYTILSREGVWLHVANCDAIVHLAAYTDLIKSWKEPTECFLANVVGTQNIIRAARSGQSVKRIVAASDLIVGHEANWKSPYAISKIAMENLLWDAPFSTCALRLGTVYGEEPLPNILEGSHDFVRLDHVVEAFTKALTSDVDGMIDVGSGEVTEAEKIARTTGCVIKKLQHPLRTVVAKVYETNHLLKMGGEQLTMKPKLEAVA